MTLTELLQAQHRRLTERRLALQRGRQRRYVALHGAQKRDPAHRSLNPKQRSDEMAAHAHFLALGIPCMACGEIDRLEVSHRIPVSEGGSNEPATLQWLCHRCHVEYDDKHSRPVCFPR